MSSTQKKHCEHFSRSQWLTLKTSRLQLFINSDFLDFSTSLIPILIINLPTAFHWQAHEQQFWLFLTFLSLALFFNTFRTMSRKTNNWEIPLCRELPCGPVYHLFHTDRCSRLPPMHKILCGISIKPGIALKKQRHNKLAYFNNFPHKYTPKKQ